MFIFTNPVARDEILLQKSDENPVSKWEIVGSLFHDTNLAP